MSDDDYSVIGFAADVVAAYVGNNALQKSELPAFIASVHAAFSTSVGGLRAPAAAEPLQPAISVKKSVTDDYIVCLEDGKKFKSLKRHIQSHYNMTPDEYRAKWNLPADYPMVAPNYAKTRSALAKKTGLGQNRRRAK
ncbi:MucR family transcriptional regulator [Pleomorphomonas oryzae]|uniref:MucR family transcriptional regulator n=1 Tax=Pleomorphomonas oryzae TaxID=261934 RepID=UPI00040F0F27|nr:MucR family transcriptional regulator [Pleomorphomonas oryzae]